jgi:hypothetical protein
LISKVKYKMKSILEKIKLFRSHWYKLRQSGQAVQSGFKSGSIATHGLILFFLAGFILPAVANAAIANKLPFDPLKMKMKRVKALISEKKGRGYKIMLTAGEVEISRSGDFIHTAGKGSCRILLSNKDIIHLGENSWVSIDNNEQGQVLIKLFQGKMVIWAIPALLEKKQPIIITTANYEFEIDVGKFGMYTSSKGDKAKVYAFNNNLLWKKESGKERKLGQGYYLAVRDGKNKKGRLKKNIESRISKETSPEEIVVNKSIHAFANKKFNAARKSFKLLQKSFPFSGEAAYYLGLINFEQENYREVIKQWRLYKKIDPQGADKHQISKKLTLLVNQQMKAEIAAALNNEQVLSNSPPVPGTIAVQPLIVKGGKQERLIAKGLTAMLTSDLARIPGVKVVEREKIQKLMDEIKLTGSNLSEKGNSTKTGRLLKAEKLIIGNCSVK